MANFGRPTQTTWITSKEENQEMMAVWSDIVRDITEATKNLIPDIAKWVEKVLHYNVPGGKQTRALALVYSYKLLAPSDQLTEENIRLARILAWCIEIMQAYLLVLDDIEDRSLIRRGQPCWYQYNDIGLAAINDGLMLEQVMYYIIRKYFKEKDYYVDLLETFHDIIFKTLLGQALDLISTNFGKKPILDSFTMNQYDAIAEYKTSYYTYILPVILAMHLAGIKDPEMFKQAIPILSEIGRFYQIQDDYISCFGDLEVCGKDHTDIEEGRCTWLVIIALQRATPEQRKILEECYGVGPDPEKIKRVIQLFIDLNLPSAYSTFEEETYNEINVHIQQLSYKLPHNLFSKLLKQLYHRTK